MSVIRRIEKITVSRNGSKIDKLGETNEVHNFSDNDGALESVYYEETLNQQCGCFAPPGGRCYECGVISCVKCHQHCGGSDTPTSLGCGKPLCREHSHYIELDGGVSLPFCSRCRGKITRKRFRKKIIQLFVYPFIEIEHKNDQQQHT